MIYFVRDKLLDALRPGEKLATRLHRVLGNGNSYQLKSPLLYTVGRKLRERRGESQGYTIRHNKKEETNRPFAAGVT